MPFCTAQGASKGEASLFSFIMLPIFVGLFAMIPGAAFLSRERLPGCCPASSASCFMPPRANLQKRGARRNFHRYLPSTTSYSMSTILMFRFNDFLAHAATVGACLAVQYGWT